MKCASCGAEIPPGAVRCEFCDSACEAVCASAVPQAESNVFDQIKQSPQYLKRNLGSRLAALPAVSPLGVAAPVLFFVLFVGVALFMATSAHQHGAPVVFTLFPMIFVVVGVLGGIHVVRQFVHYQQSPTLARAAVIVGKRTEVSGGSGDSSASTRYFFTAEFEDGARCEFSLASAKLFGQVAEGDAGVLFSRAEVAMGFDRIASIRSRA